MTPRDTWGAGIVMLMIMTVATSSPCELWVKAAAPAESDRALAATEDQRNIQEVLPALRKNTAAQHAFGKTHLSSLAISVQRENRWTVREKMSGSYGKSIKNSSVYFHEGFFSHVRFDDQRIRHDTSHCSPLKSKPLWGQKPFPIQAAVVLMTVAFASASEASSRSEAWAKLRAGGCPRKKK